MSSNINIPEVENFRKIQMRKKRKRMIVLVGIVLTIMIITMLMIIRIINHYKPSPQFMFLTEKEISDNYQVKSLIIRDETVFRSSEKGKVRSLFADGSKVAKNETLAYVIPESQKAELEELQSVEDEIINYQYSLIDENSNAGAKQIYDESSNQTRRILSNVYTALLNRNFLDISTDESALNDILDLRNQRLRNYNFKDDRLEDLLDHYHNLEEALGAKSNLVQSSQSGIYIRSYDGLEDRLNPANINNLTASQLNNYLKDAPQGRLETIDQVEQGDPLYCLTNSIEQYFAFFIPSGNSSSAQVSSRVNAQTKDGINLQEGLIVQSDESEYGTMIVINCNTSLERLADRRIVDLHVELNKKSGLRVPISALSDYKAGNVESDILIENSGYIEKTRVKVVETNEDYALIENLEGAEYPVAVSTMIVLNPKDVSVGDSATGMP